MDTVVISDIHLGHDVYAMPRPDSQQRIDLINKNLGLFLDRLAERSIALARPLTLVILGDFIDFCKASFAYSEADKVKLDWSDDAERAGLPVTEKNCAWKLAGIAAAHRPIFDALGRLLEAGNRLVIVSGNHDAMFYWKGVKDALRAAVLAHVDDGAAELGGKIEFRHWFYREPGAFYMEHGHRLDPLSTSECPLLPTDMYDPKRVFLPMNLLTIQYYAQNFYGLTSEQVQFGTIREVLASAFASTKSDRRPLRHYLTPLKIYLRFIVFVTWRWLGQRFIVRDWRRRDSMRALRREAQRAGVDLGSARKLYGLNAAPFERSLARVYQLFCFDILLLVLAAAVGIPLLARAALDGPDPLFRTLTVAALAPLTIALVAMRFRGRGALLHHSDALRPKLAEIARLMRVPAVVVGHTHVMSWSARDNEVAIANAGDEAEGRGRHLVFNSGNWEGQDGRASYLLFEAVPSGFRVKTRLWNLKTQEELLLDDLPLRRQAKGGDGAVRTVPLGPDLVVDEGPDGHRLRGVLDAGARLDRLFPPRGHHVALDLGGVARVTSAGVAAWVRALAAKPAGLRVTLTDCPPRLVDAFRATAGALRPEVRVLSFRQPVACPACRRADVVLVHPGESGHAVKLPPCAACGRPTAPLGLLPGECCAFIDEARRRIRLSDGEATAVLSSAALQLYGDIRTLSQTGLSVYISDLEAAPSSISVSELLDRLSQDELGVQLLLTPGADDSLLEARGRVRWKRVLLDGSVELGLELTSTSRVCRDVLTALVDERSRRLAAARRRRADA